MNTTHATPTLTRGLLKQSQKGLWFAYELDDDDKVVRRDGAQCMWPVGHQSEVQALEPGPCDLLIRERPRIARTIRLQRGRWQERGVGTHHPVYIVQDDRTVEAIDRLARAAAHLRRALARWGPPDADAEKCHAWLRGDLGANQHVVDYQCARSQQRYAHMYAAKHLGLWRALRAVLDWNGGGNRRLLSIGSGPQLDLMGWCWDRAFRGPKLAMDPLTWHHVLDDPDWDAAVQRLCDPLDTRPGWYVPDGPPPAQLVHLPILGPVPTDELTCDDTVLLPFVVNHLLTPAGTWLRALADKGARLAIADLHQARPELWDALLGALGCPRLAQETFQAQPVADRFAELYPEPLQRYRTYRGKPQHCAAKVLAFDADTGWRFVGGPRG